MAFEILTKLNNQAETVITQLMLNPIDVLTTGVAMVAVPMMAIWILYKGYMIMGGFQEAYLPAFIKEYTIKFVVLFIAGSSAYYLHDVGNIIKDTPMAMTKDLTGETKVLNLVENKLEVALKNLDKATSESADAPPDNYPDSYMGDVLRRWNELISPITDIGDSISTFWDAVIVVLKLMIIIAGLLYLAITLSIIILINKGFFMLCLGFGPLFLAFLAFDKTKGYFQSWLNYTLGLGMSYVAIMFTANILMSILDILWQDGVSFMDAIGSLFVCVVLSVAIARVGDIASAWFSAGNISDGTAAAMAVATRGMGSRIKGMGQTIGSNAKNLRDLPNDLRNRFNTKYAYGRNKSAYNRAKRIKAARKKNSSTSINKGE